MNIYLYTIDKKKNSTKVPNTTGTLVSCVLKEATSINNPTFILTNKPANNINYVEWDGRYYWINNLTYQTANLWSIDCSIDVLATYATQIKAGKCYIEFSSAYNDRIPDPRPSKLTNPNVISSTGTMYTNFSPDSGSLIITVSGSESVGCYKFNGDPVDLIGDLYSWWNTFDLSDIPHAIWNLGLYILSGDVSQNLKSVVWIPWSISAGTSDPIYLGMYDTGKTAQRINMYSKQGFTSSVSIPVPTIPNWRIQSGYCEYNLYLPLIGNITLPTDELNGETTLNISGCLDETTGDISLQLMVGSKCLGVYGASTGSSVPIGGAGFTPKQAMTALLGGVGMAMTGGALATGAIGEMAGIGALTSEAGGLLNISPNASTIGGASGKSGAGLSSFPVLSCTYWDTSDAVSNFTDTIGCPTFKVGTIGNYSYVRGSQVSLPISGYGDHVSMINAFISGGVFVE